MKVYFVKTPGELPKSNYEPVVKGFRKVREGTAYIYHGYEVHKLNCKEKFLRVMGLVWKILLAMVLVGLPGMFPCYQGAFKRDVKELKLGFEKHHYYVPQHRLV